MSRFIAFGTPSAKVSRLWRRPRPKRREYDPAAPDFRAFELAGFDEAKDYSRAELRAILRRAIEGGAE